MQSSEADIRGLYQRLSTGDRAVYERLYERFAPDLRAYLAARCTGIRDPGDVAQDVWLQIWRKRSTFDGQNFPGWMYAIARNRIIDLARKRREATGAENLDPMAPLRSVMSEKLDALRDCMKETGGDFIRVLRAQLDGNSTGEIARQEGIDSATVYSRVKRGKRQIRDCVQRKLS